MIIQKADHDEKKHGYVLLENEEKGEALVLPIGEEVKVTEIANKTGILNHKKGLLEETLGQLVTVKRICKTPVVGTLDQIFVEWKGEEYVTSPYSFLEDS